MLRFAGEKSNLIFFSTHHAFALMHANKHIPTMLWVNVWMALVELSGIRCTRRPSLGGAVTAKTMDWFLRMSLTLLVTTWSSCLEIGVTEPAGWTEETNERGQQTIPNMWIILTAEGTFVTSRYICSLPCWQVAVSVVQSKP